MKKTLLVHLLLISSFSLIAQFIEIDKGQHYQIEDFELSVHNHTFPQSVHQNFTPPPQGDVDPQLAALLQYVLDSMTTDLGAVGLSASLILPDGNVWKGASGIHNINNAPLTSDMRLGMGSVSKTLTAAVIMQLVEEGAISLDDTLGTWLPQYPNIDLGIELRMLLNHTSGIYNYTNNPAFGTYLNQNLSAFIDVQTVLNNWVGTPYFEPGTSWEYSNTNYALLGLIIEAVTGNDYHTAVRNRLILPNGLDSWYLYPQELPTGPVSNLWLDLTGDGLPNDYTSAGLSDVGLFSAAWAAGAYMTTAEDLAHWVKYLMTGEIVSQSTLEQMMDTYQVSANFDYGLGIYNVEALGNQWWGHDGYIYYQTLAMYSPDLDVSMVLMCNNGNFQQMGLVYFSLIQTYLDYEPVVNTFDMEAPYSNLSVYPNPVSESIFLSITNEKAAPAYLNIYNHFGQMVYSEELILNKGHQTFSIEKLPDFPAGIYSLQLSADERILVEQFIRQ